MPVRPRFVFDTNAVISATLLKRSISRKAFDKAIEVQGIPIVTPRDFMDRAWKTVGWELVGETLQGS